MSGTQVDVVPATPESQPDNGQVLIDDGLVSASDVTAARRRRKLEGGTLEHHLLTAGALTLLQLYDTLGRVWDAPRVDLIQEPPDPALLEKMSYQACLREGWTPWRHHQNGVTVATTVPPDDAMRRLIVELYGVERVDFRATTPWDLWHAMEFGHRDRMLFQSQDWLATARPGASARSGLARWQQLAPLGLLAVAGVSLVISPMGALILLMAAANTVFLLSILFKTLASIIVPLRLWRATGDQLVELRERQHRGLTPIWRERTADIDLPVYSILIPVYREANVLGQIMDNMQALDYPKSKLDVMVLLEADDVETIAVARQLRLPGYVRLIVVPPGHPQTKPRACNYGLAFARGRYVVIFDAEDRPEPQQLRKAAAAFERDSLMRRHHLTNKRPLAVVQASLHYYNADYNVLTRMFAIEYAHWFEAMLPGMDEASLPLPLGGTSNHFDTEILRAMGAWDPYNVTEDADAGLRASLMGYRVAIINSSTGEEACAEVGAWLRQRTRWIKGYMLTAAVNSRRPLRFARDSGARGVVGLLGLIAATPIAFLSYPVALALTVTTYIGIHLISEFLPPWLVAINVFTFLFGNSLMIVSAGVAATRRYTWRIGIFAIFSPAYWLLHSIAAWRALYQVLRDPHRWEKTPHGLSDGYESEAHL